MDINAIRTKASDLFRKYRYPILILVLGMAILCFSGKKPKETVQPTPLPAVLQPDLSESLRDILSQIQGVGKVEVMLTVAVGETTIYQCDEDTSGNADSSTVRKETVILTDAQRNQLALISQILPPSYKGAIIVCQGADNAGVKLAVVEAVSKATGLGADDISVLKMK